MYDDRDRKRGDDAGKDKRRKVEKNVIIRCIGYRMTAEY